MKKTLLAVTMLSLSLSAVAQDTVRMIITKKDGTQEVVNAKADANSYQNGSVTFEKDIAVKAPASAPTMYRKGSNLENAFAKEIIKTLSTGSNTSSNADYVPNDEFFNEQIHWLDHQGSDIALNSVLSSVQQLSPRRRPVVGVIDSGFYAHPDLIYADGYNFATSGDSVRGEYFFIPEEYNGSPADRTMCSVHGTGVAGVAVATRDNNIGFAGIADADFIAVRSMACGGGFLHDTAEGLSWMLGEQVDDIRAPVATADVVNISLGGQVSHCPSFMERAIDKATEANVPVVVAIGNDSIDASGFTPANCANSISVAAATREGDLFPSSNFGTAIDIVALGKDVVSATEDPNSLGWWEESSFAAPIVTGVIANVVSEHSEVSIDEIKFFLSVTATPFIAGQCDDSNRCGAGILDAEAFSQAVRDYKNNEIAVLKPALSNTELCDKTLYATDDNEMARLCSTFELVLPEHQSNRDDIRFEVLAFEKGDVMSHENGTLALTATSSKLLVSSLNMDTQDYGVRMCNSERCYGTTAVKINDMSENLPDMCKD